MAKFSASSLEPESTDILNLCLLLNIIIYTSGLKKLELEFLTRDRRKILTSQYQFSNRHYFIMQNISISEETYKTNKFSDFIKVDILFG